MKLGSYEFLGVIVPGVIVTYGFALMFPELSLLKATEKVSFGEVGLMLVLAFVAGQLLQALGNLVEDFWWWLFRGWPSDWVYEKKTNLLSSAQYEDLFIKISKMLGRPKFDPGSAHSKPWKAITRQVYAAVARSGGTARIDVFNGNYGMFRGIVAAVIVTGLAGAVSGRIEDYRIYGGLVVMLALALLRMHRFAIVYARELFVAFLLLDPSDAVGEAGDGASAAGVE
jgi:hypothetical protein